MARRSRKKSPARRKHRGLSGSPLTAALVACKGSKEFRVCVNRKLGKSESK